MSTGQNTPPDGASEAGSPADPDDGVIRSLPPVTQAAFLGFFSLLYTAVFTLLALWHDSKSVPPWPYFAVLSLLYVLFWFPFHIPVLRAVPRALATST